MLVVLETMILAGMAGATIHISLKPSFVHTPAETDVRIRCSLDAMISEVDRVYSIILQKRQQTVAVADEDHESQVLDPDCGEALVISSFSGPSSFLEVTLKNVSCKQRENYRCKAAARKGNHNLKLETEFMRLNVIGEECKVDYTVVPNKATYDTEEEISVTFFTFTKSVPRVKWQCFQEHENSELVDPPAGTCSNKTDDGMYNCSTQFPLIIKTTKPYDLECGIGRDKITLDLNVDCPSASQVQAQEVNAWLASEPSPIIHRQEDAIENVTSVILGTMLAVSVMIIVLVILFFRWNMGKCRGKRKTGETPEQKPLNGEASPA